MYSKKTNVSTNIKKIFAFTLTSLALVILLMVPRAPINAASIGSVSYTPGGGFSISGCTKIGGVYVGGRSGSGGTSFGIGSSGSSCENAAGIGLLVLDTINQVLVPLIFAIAFIVFVWGMFRYFIAGGADVEGQAKGKQLLLYGIIGFVIMISLWGIVNVIASTLNLSGAYHPPFPII